MHLHRLAQGDDPRATEGGRERQRNVLDRFAIDFSLCMYCGICIEVCPFDALFWSPEFEYAELDIRDLTHEKDRLRRVDVRPCRRRPRTTSTPSRPRRSTAARQGSRQGDRATVRAGDDLASRRPVTSSRLLFGLLGLVALGSALLVVTTRQLVHAALWLVVTLGALAGCYLLLAAEFVAWVQVLIYVGAVVVLLLFGADAHPGADRRVAGPRRPPLRRRRRRRGRGRGWPCSSASRRRRPSTASTIDLGDDRGPASATSTGAAAVPVLGAAVRGAVACCCSPRWSARSCCPGATSVVGDDCRAAGADAAADAACCSRRCCSASGSTACWPGATRPRADGRRADAQRGQPQPRRVRRVAARRAARPARCSRCSSSRSPPPRSGSAWRSCCSCSATAETSPARRADASCADRDAPTTGGRLGDAPVVRRRCWRPSLAAVVGLLVRPAAGRGSSCRSRSPAPRLSLVATRRCSRARAVTDAPVHEPAQLASVADRRRSPIGARPARRRAGRASCRSLVAVVALARAGLLDRLPQGRPALLVVRRLRLAVHRRDAARRLRRRPVRAAGRLGGHGRLLLLPDRPPLGAGGRARRRGQGVPHHPARRRRLPVRHLRARPSRRGTRSSISARRCGHRATALRQHDGHGRDAAAARAASSASRRSSRCTPGCPTRWPARRRSAR